MYTVVQVPPVTTNHLYMSKNPEAEKVMVGDQRVAGTLRPSSPSPPSISAGYYQVITVLNPGLTGGSHGKHSSEKEGEKKVHHDMQRAHAHLHTLSSLILPILYLPGRGFVMIPSVPRLINPEEMSCFRSCTTRLELEHTFRSVSSPREFPIPG